MKYTAHVPVEQYGYIEITDIETRDEAILAYKQLAADFKDEEGLPEADFRAILDDLLDDGVVSGDPGDIADRANPRQKLILNEVKKGLKRLAK